MVERDYNLGIYSTMKGRYWESEFFGALCGFDADQLEMGINDLRVVCVYLIIMLNL